MTKVVQANQNLHTVANYSYAMQNLDRIERAVTLVENGQKVVDLPRYLQAYSTILEQVAARDGQGVSPSLRNVHRQLTVKIQGMEKKVLAAVAKSQGAPAAPAESAEVQKGKKAASSQWTWKQIAKYSAGAVAAVAAIVLYPRQVIQVVQDIPGALKAGAAGVKNAMDIGVNMAHSGEKYAQGVFVTLGGMIGLGRVALTPLRTLGITTPPIPATFEETAGLGSAALIPSLFTASLWLGTSWLTKALSDMQRAARGLGQAPAGAPPDPVTRLIGLGLVTYGTMSAVWPELMGNVADIASFTKDLAYEQGSNALEIGRQFNEDNPAIVSAATGTSLGLGFLYRQAVYNGLAAAARGVGAGAVAVGSWIPSAISAAGTGYALRPAAEELSSLASESYQNGAIADAIALGQQGVAAMSKTYEQSNKDGVVRASKEFIEDHPTTITGLSAFAAKPALGLSKSIAKGSLRVAGSLCTRRVLTVTVLTGIGVATALPASIPYLAGLALTSLAGLHQSYQSGSIGDAISGVSDAGNHLVSEGPVSFAAEYPTTTKVLAGAAPGLALSLPVAASGTGILLGSDIAYKSYQTGYVKDAISGTKQKWNALTTSVHTNAAALGNTLKEIAVKNPGSATTGVALAPTLGVLVSKTALIGRVATAAGQATVAIAKVLLPGRYYRVTGASAKRNSLALNTRRTVYVLTVLAAAATGLGAPFTVTAAGLAGLTGIRMLYQSYFGSAEMVEGPTHSSNQ